MVAQYYPAYTLRRYSFKADSHAVNSLAPGADQHTTQSEPGNKRYKDGSVGNKRFR